MASSQKSPAEPIEFNYETLDQLLGYHMKRAFNVIQADLALTLQPLGLRMLTYTALVLIVDNPDLSQTQLAAAMDIERANLVVIVDELEERELITRDRVPDDRRAYALNATSAGRKLYRKAVRAVVAHEAKLLSKFSVKNKATLIKSLAALHVLQRN